MAYFQSFFTNYSYDHLAMYHERFKRNYYYINIKGRDIFNHVFKYYIRNGIDVNIVFCGNGLHQIFYNPRRQRFKKIMRMQTN